MTLTYKAQRNCARLNDFMDGDPLPSKPSPGLFDLDMFTNKNRMMAIAHMDDYRNAEILYKSWRNRMAVCVAKGLQAQAVAGLSDAKRSMEYAIKRLQELQK